MPASPHPRHNALAELDVHIARAEAARAKYLLDLEAAHDVRRARGFLRQAEDHLAWLHRSREVLLAEKEGR
jgi:hypothetical protein